MLKCRNCAMMLKPSGLFCYCCGASFDPNAPFDAPLYSEYHESPAITRESKYGFTVKSQVFLTLTNTIGREYSDDWPEVYAQTIKANGFSQEEIAEEVEIRKKMFKEYVEPTLKIAEDALERLKELKDSLKEKPPERSPGLRAQVFEVIVRQALQGFPWETLFKEPMQTHNIEPGEIEAEVERRQTAAHH